MRHVGILAALALLYVYPQSCPAQIAKLVVEHRPMRCNTGACKTIKGTGTACYVGEKDGLQWWVTAKHVVSWPGHKFLGASIKQPNQHNKNIDPATFAYNEVPAQVKMLARRHDLAVLASKVRPPWKPFKIRMGFPQPGETMSVNGFPFGGKKRFQVGIAKPSNFTRYQFVVTKRPDEGESGGAVCDREGRLLGIINAYPVVGGQKITECLYTSASIVNGMLKDFFTGTATDNPYHYVTFNVPNYKQVCNGACQCYQGCKTNVCIFGDGGLFGGSWGGGNRQQELYRHIMRSTLERYRDRILAAEQAIADLRRDTDKNSSEILVIKDRLNRLELEVFGNQPGVDPIQPLPVPPPVVDPLDPNPVFIQGQSREQQLRRYYQDRERRLREYYSRGNRISGASRGRSGGVVVPQIYPPVGTPDPDPLPDPGRQSIPLDDYALILQVYRGEDLILEDRKLLDGGWLPFTIPDDMGASRAGARAHGGLYPRSLDPGFTPRATEVPLQFERPVPRATPNQETSITPTPEPVQSQSPAQSPAPRVSIPASNYLRY